MFRIGGEHHRDNLRLVEIAFREQRPHRAVDHPAGEGILFRHAAFALDIAAGILPAA